MKNESEMKKIRLQKDKKREEYKPKRKPITGFLTQVKVPYSIFPS